VKAAKQGSAKDLQQQIGVLGEIRDEGLREQAPLQMPNRGRLGKARLPNGPAKDSSGLDYLFTAL